MAERRVKWALIHWPTTDTKTGRQVEVKAFRDQVVDIPDEHVDAFDEMGAVVDPADELLRPGQILPLAEDAGDEELVSWVAGANNDEIDALARQRPTLAARIASAREVVAEQIRIREELLGSPSAPIVDGDRGPASLGDLVKGSVEKVSAYIADHPDEAQDVLDAETDHRAGNPRPGVIRAAEAAAGFTPR